MTPFSYGGGITTNPYGGLAKYGSWNLTVSSPPQQFTEPLTIDEVRSYLELNDNSQDGLLSGMISGAREQAEILQGKDLVRKQWDLTMDYWQGYAIELRDPLVSVDLISYKDNAGVVRTIAENVDYIVDTNKHPGLITPYYNHTWPTFSSWPSSAILIRCTSGYAAGDLFWADAGQRVRNGIKLLISAWYNDRLPYETGYTATEMYPPVLRACLMYGARERVC